MDQPLRKRAWIELAIVGTIGIGHVIVDGWLGAKGLFIAAAIICCAFYALARLRIPGQARAWGLGKDNFKESATACSLFLLAATLVFLGYGFSRGRGAPPPVSVYLFVLYPAWGLVQQILLCALLYRNVVSLTQNRVVAATFSSLAFGLVHAPDWVLSILTAVSAAIWLSFYDRWPNLWCQGVSHGWLGGLVYVYVLERDPWREALGAY
jgi:hypothetical protein